MIVYGNWKERRFFVTTLKLDPRNARIPAAASDLSQRELTADLVEHDKVYDIAKSIADNGYYPVEALIAVEENGDKYIVEGNRRLAALKLLLSPQAAPSDYWQRRFRALANRVDRKTIIRVKIVVAPSREDAAPIIMSRHTRVQIESWNPIMQANFYANLVGPDFTAEDVATQYNVPLSHVTQALQGHMMYSVACRLELPDDAARAVQNPRDFPFTNLSRLYENPRVLEFLGIRFDDNNGFVGHVAVDEFRKGYARIVSDIATDAVGSRDLNTTENMETYLASLGGDRPDLSKKGRFTAQDLLRAPQPALPAGSAAATRKRYPRSARKPWALIPKSFSCEVNNQRINDFFTELTRLRVVQFPNAVSLMLRSLLEMSLSYYIHRTGHLVRLLETERKKCSSRGEKLRRDWSPPLRQMLSYVVNDPAGVISNPKLVRALNKLLSDKRDPLSLDSLNLYVHNEFVSPDEATLRRFWTQLQGLFEITLVEPDSDQPS